MSIFGGGHHAAAKSPTRAMGLDFQGAQYGRPIPVVYGQNKVAGNCIWYGDFQAIAVQQKQSGGKGGGGSSSTTSYDYKASYQLGICEGVGNIVNVYNGTSTVSLASLGAVVATGTQGQAPWAHLSGNAALGYSGTVVVSFQNRDLGSSASLPNDNFEVAGLAQFGSGIVDANPAAILSDICTNQYYGINFGQLGSTTQYSNYCVAAGLFMSPVFDSQSTGQQALSDLLKYTNADAWFSEGQLKIGCYGDQSLTGNGVTYTPNNTAVADLTAADFITNGSAPPVTISRKSPADAFNIERLEFADRANTYHTSAVVASLDYSVVKSGARADKSDTYHGITTSAVARLVAQNLVQRDFYVRNSYQFRLSWRYCYLEPFDIVTLTDANTGLQSTPARITEVSEDEYGLLAITAEEFPLGIGHGDTYSTQANGGTTVDPNTDPGPVAAPYLFRGPGFLVGNNTPEIWCAVTGNGNPLWSGCDVYLSHDGTSYTFLSTYARQARYGELTNSMGVQADPDSTSAPNVVLNGYDTQLLGGTQADADNFTTLAMIDSEIVSYETATLASGPSYNLSYLRRGAYGSTIAAHAANAPFVRLDDGILRIPVDPSQIGQTIYIKFLSRNCFGRTPRTLAGETAYTYVIGTNVELPDVPDVPASFAVQGVADGVSITWTNDNPAAVGCTSIERATASGGPWTVLAQVGPTTTAYHDSFTNGATYYYRARARGPLVQSGWSAYTDVFSSTGVDVSKATIANVQTLLNGGFLLGLSNWIAAQGWTSDATPRAVYTGFAGASGTLTLANTVNVPCVPGSQIIGQALLSSNAANGACYAGVEFLDSAGAHLAYAFGNSITGTTAATLSRKVALAPASAAFARFFLGAANCTTGTYYAQSCLMTVTLSTLDELPDSASRFAAAQAGADKTSLNTAADTAKVNGVASSSISPIGALMPQEAGANKTETRTSALTASLSNQTQDALGDGTTYARMKAASLTGNDFDFAKGGVNKHLGNVPDGGSRYAVINGAGLKAVSSVDANNRAGIDFTQSLHVGKSLANIPDDPTSARYAVANIDGNRRALIDATQAGHVGAWNLDSRVADGTTYARTSSGALTGGNVDLAKAGVINKNLGNIADGGGRYGVHAVDGNNLALIDFSQAGHVNKTIDNVGDGATYLRMPGANMDANRRGLVDFTQAGHVGKVLDNIGDTGSYARTPATSWHPENVPNASFTSPAVNGVVPGWGATNATLSITPAGGPFALQVVAIAGGVAGAYFTPSNACQPGDVVSATATCDVTTGNSATARLQVQCFDVNGNALTPTGSVDVVVTSAYNAQATATALATMPANAASFRLFAYVNSNAGATFLILNPRVSVNDLRVAGSGMRLGDQRNAPSSLTSNIGFLRSATAIVAQSTGSVNINAHSLTRGTVTTSYNAITNAVTGLAQSAGYYIYAHDNYAGGSPTWIATQSAFTANSYDDAYNAGWVVIPTSGSAGGGAAGANCVCADMWLRPGLTARDLAERWRWWRPYILRGQEGWHFVRKRPLIAQEPCVRITVADGSWIECSISTPVILRDGERLRAPDVWGREMFTDHGWQRVVECELLTGLRDVVRIDLGQHTMLAGADPARRLDTHNWKQ